MPKTLKFANLLLIAALVSSCTDTEPVAPLPPIQPHRAPSDAFNLAAPMFGLDATRDNSILAAVASAGVMRIRHGRAELVAALPGANDVADSKRGPLFAITGGATDPGQILPTSRKLFEVSRGTVKQVADLWAFEQQENPDAFWHTGPNAVESNPFDVEVLYGNKVVITDAAANDLLIVNERGHVDWIAVFTPVVPGGPEPVPTSVAIGPDGAYYVGELTGFPGTPGLSRIWRIKAGSRHAICPGPRCSVFATGFTSIIDLAFDGNETLYVVELDEASWFALELNGFHKTPAGGTVTRCQLRSGRCRVAETNLSLPTAITVDKHGKVWITEHDPTLFTAARVRRLDH